jgi:solute carrier family 44 protein 1 (choline transporter-like protein)
LFQILIAAFAIVYGNPLLLINGYDSFGNICGTQNEMTGALDLSGLDMTDRP